MFVAFIFMQGKVGLCPSFLSKSVFSSFFHSRHKLFSLKYLKVFKYETFLLEKIKLRQSGQPIDKDSIKSAVYKKQQQ